MSEHTSTDNLTPEEMRTILGLRLWVARAANKDSLAWWDDGSLTSHAGFLLTSALIADTKVLLAAWDPERSVTGNLDRARRENIFGKASRKRVEDILLIFRQRYFDDADVGTAMVTLTQNGAPAQWIGPPLYFFSAQNDNTRRDTVVEMLCPRHQAGYMDLPVEVVVRGIRDWVVEGKTMTRWGDNTIARVARSSLAALRDSGVFQGTAKSQLTPIYLLDLQRGRLGGPHRVPGRHSHGVCLCPPRKREPKSVRTSCSAACPRAA